MLKSLYFLVSFYFFAAICSTSNAAIVINEIMYRPSTLRADEEFVELYNPDMVDADLSGWAFVDGINYQFPKGARLAAGGYLIVSPSPEAFLAKYGDASVWGPYQGQLNNKGERVVLEDAANRPVDSVLYCDEVGWPSTADGYGPSLERKHPRMDSNHPNSWQAGPADGTPRRKNQAAVDAPFPIVTEAAQKPAVPNSTQSVTITARFIHPFPILIHKLYYKPEYNSTFAEAEMADDGLHGDGMKGDGIFGGVIPPFPTGTVVDFYVEAKDIGGVSGFFPLDGTKRAAIYLVDDAHYSTGLPLYRIVMRTADEIDLRRRDPNSNVELDSSFIYGNDIYYNVGVRFRGKGSRYKEPKSYRVNFTETRHFGSIRKLDLNSQNVDRQFIGLECFKRLRLPAPEKQFVSLAFNQTFVHNYLQVERCDKYMMQRLFGDGDGNLYRGVEQANLDYRGKDPKYYRTNYIKETNELEDDFSDIVRLCEAFSQSTDSEFPAAVAKRINVQQWIRWFALKEFLNDLEGGISLERGDDYYIYRYPADDLFYLLPWDLDSVFAKPFQTIHHHGTPSAQRLLRHPAFASFYYQDLLSLLNNELPQDAVDSIIEMTAPVSDEKRRLEIKGIARELREFILSSIPRSISCRIETINSKPESIVADGEEWRYFRGVRSPSADPLGWTQNGFDDSSWETGPSGFGYSDNDDRTILSDMMNRYTTVFTRKTFHLSDPQRYSYLTLHALVDDGFAAYLNGAEIARDNVGETPLFDSLADSSNEADSVLSYTIADPSAYLLPGENVLAAVGVNVNIDSSDLSLAISLDAQLSGGEMARLYGAADPSRTKRILVNGNPADYTAWIPRWEYIANLKMGRNSFHIEALDAAGKVIDATRFSVIQGDAPPDGAMALSGDAIWTKRNHPILLEQTLIIPENVTLAIEPGVEVQAAPSAAIIVYGTLSAIGSEDAPILFSAMDAANPWGGIAADAAAGPLRLTCVRFSNVRPYSFNGTDYRAAVATRFTPAVIENCEFSDMDSLGVNAFRSNLTLRNNRFRKTKGGISAEACDSLIEGNRFQNMSESGNAIDLRGEFGSPSLVRGNRVEGAKSGIALSLCSSIVENNWVESCSMNGLSSEGEGAPLLVNNVFWRNTIGVSLANRSQAQLIHDTIVQSVTGVVGQGEGAASIVNCVVWDAQQPIAADNRSSWNIVHSDIMGWPQDGANFSRDPLFADPAAGDFHPRWGSPLIEAGVDMNITKDFDGRLRPMNSLPDAGAFEYDPATPISDWFYFGEFPNPLWR
ncbi:MAG: CotH kinase family protein [Candidatus Omnitrophota bacterium]